MNPILKAGTRVVVLALISYSLGIWREQRKQTVTRAVLLFLSIGIFFDILATTFMIIGSPNSPFTLHGFLGYSALAAMLVDTFLIWKTQLVEGKNAAVPRKLHLYSRFAYLWWVIAFITGGLLVFMK